MTIQTKRFIELPDILAVRFACKHCGVTISFPITDSKLLRPNPNSPFLNVCPSCHQVWADFGMSTYEPTITKAMAALNQLRILLYGDTPAPSPAPLGFTLSLEITSEPVMEPQPGKSVS
jgi:hypothetical protein